MWKLFLHFIRERHNVYLRKEAGLPKPWTKDKVIQQVYFTNPYRENDRVTKWYAENIRNKLYKDTRVIFATITFRWFNLPSTGEALMNAPDGEWPFCQNLLWRWNTKAAVAHLTRLKNQGNKIFTGAFNISNSGSTKPKINRVCEDYIEPVWMNRHTLVEELARGAYERKITLAGAQELFMELPGLGGSGFMAAQIVADLKFTKFLENAPDWWTWCSPGPGSIRGLNILLGSSNIKQKVPKFLWHVNELRKKVNQALPLMPTFSAQDIQNCLCEFSKMVKVREGGRFKRKYKGV
jgi:hypothetical protein